MEKTDQELDQMRKILMEKHQELVQMALEYCTSIQSVNRAEIAFRFYHNIRTATRA